MSLRLAALCLSWVLALPAQVPASPDLPSLHKGMDVLAVLVGQYDKRMEAKVPTKDIPARLEA